MQITTRLALCITLTVLLATLTTTLQAAPPTLIIYSGRSERLVGPIITQFQKTSGIPVKVRWGKTAELAATLLEEGKNTPADLFWAQDPGGLGAVASLLSPLPDDILQQVDPRFRDRQQRWVGISGRARVIVYNRKRIPREELPRDLWGLTDPKWRGRIGWAPTNASFQTMVTAMRVLWGEEKTREWLQGMLANKPKIYPKNTPIVAAVGAGEIDVGLVNHYYLYRFLKEEGEDFPARNYFLPGGGPGSLVMVAGAGILASSEQQEAARQFLRFLLSPTAQRYFATQTFEYPLAQGIPAPHGLVPLPQLNSPRIDLADLADLKGTIRLLRDVGALP
ncbi:MAG: iron ABC transporter substrate-binding protein [Nitrospinota bacterium]|nr:MAG: iron ABC transporter substrate-binding protein [Nitrospinota bacterium]